MNPENNLTAENDELEIDLIDLGYALLDKLHYIVLCFLTGALLFNLYAFFLIEPTYQSTAKLYMVSSSDDSVVNLSDLNIGTSLTADYEELIMSYPVLNQVIEKMNLKMNSEELARLITLNNPNNTRVLRITVTSTDPELARDIANTLAEISAEYLPETMNTLSPNIAQHAKLAAHKAGPSYLKYTLMGALLGMMLCCGLIVVRYLLDDTVHTVDDLEKYFGLVPLTAIPDSDIFAEKDEADKKGRRNRKGSHDR